MDVDRSDGSKIDLAPCSDLLVREDDMSTSWSGDGTARPRITLDHGSVCVGDIDEAIRFYGDLLGLERVERPDFGFPGAWFRAGSTPVHLTTGGATPGSAARLRPNESHLAFCVEQGLEQLIARLEQAGVRVWELEDSPAADRQVFLHDPWGNMLELCRYGTPGDSGDDHRESER